MTAAANSSAHVPPSVDAFMTITPPATPHEQTKVFDGEIDRGLWEATLLDIPHDIEGTESSVPDTNPYRMRLLKDYPLQAAYEQFLEDYFEDGVQCELAFYQFILMEDLRLAWLACKAIFNEQATPDVAWRIYLETKKEASARVGSSPVRTGLPELG